MPNVFQNPDMLAAKSLDFFDNNLVAAKLVDRQWESKFGVEGAKIGDSLRLRKANNFTVRTGNLFTPQNIEEETLTLTIDTPLGVDFVIDNADMALTVDRFEERYAKPALRALANKVDRFVLELYKDVPNATGTFNTAPSADTDFLNPRTRLRQFGVPEDEQTYVLDPVTEAAAVATFDGFFNQQELIGKQYAKGRMGRALGCDWMVSQNIPIHTAGVIGGTVLVDGNGQSGSSLLLRDATGGVTNWARKGDIFTVGSVNAVNPITGEDLGVLRQFVVTADANSSAAGAVTLSIYPAIVTSGPRKTVSAALVDGDTITWFATTGQVAAQPMLTHPKAFALAIVAEPAVRGVHSSSMKSDPDSGIGIRYVCWFDGDTNQFKFRYDVLCGRLAQLPDWAVRIHTS